MCLFKKNPPIPFPLFLLCGPNILLLHESFLLFHHICFSSPQQTKYFPSPYYFFLFLPSFSSPPKNFSKYFLPLPSMFNSSSEDNIFVARNSRKIKQNSQSLLGLIIFGLFWFLIYALPPANDCESKLKQTRKQTDLVKVGCISDAVHSRNYWGSQASLNQAGPVKALSWKLDQ